MFEGFFSYENIKKFNVKNHISPCGTGVWAALSLKVFKRSVTQETHVCCRDPQVWLGVPQAGHPLRLFRAAAA